MKTHKVLDLVYTVEEGQDCFDGTLQECNDFVMLQPNNLMYKVVPMTAEEIESHPDNKSSKPKFEVKKKNQPKTDLVVIYTKPKSELGDPEPDEVNKAFNLIKEIEKTNKGLNFLNHISMVFNPYTFNHFNKVINDGEVCCLTNKKIAGLVSLSKKLAEVTPMMYTAKKLSGQLSQSDVDERNKKFAEMPEEYRVQRIGYFSQNSDKKISIAGFIALKYYLLEDTTRLLKLKLKTPTIDEMLGITKETPEQYLERKRKEKLTRPDATSYNIGERNFSILQEFKDKLKQ